MTAWSPLVTIFLQGKTHSHTDARGHLELLSAPRSSGNTVLEVSDVKTFCQPNRKLENHFLPTAPVSEHQVVSDKQLDKADRQNTTRLTMAKPESSADVLLEAFSLARLRYSFLHDSAWTEWWLELTSSR